MPVDSMTLFSCNSSDSIPVEQVNSSDVVSDIELRQQQFNKQPQPKTFYFGFDLRNSLLEDAAQYLPFLKYLESATGYRFKLVFTSKHSSTVKLSGKDEIQFAAMGAIEFLQAPDIPISGASR